GIEEDLPVEARLVDLPVSPGTGRAHHDPLAVRTESPRWPPQPGRRQPGFRGDFHVLLPARRDLLRLHGNLFQPVPRRDARKNAALLLPDADASGSSGRW